MYIHKQKLLPLPWYAKDHNPMRIPVNTLGYCCITILFASIFSCNSDDPSMEQNPIANDPLSIKVLDSLADHFQFVSSTEIAGQIPAATGASSLKYDIKDTLRLIPGIYIPVRFLHDKNSNVTGVFIQVTGLLESSENPTEATYYHDVPEIPDVAESDTVSEFMIQFNPGDFDVKLPITFELKLVPHNAGNQPLDEATVPVMVESLDYNIGNSGGRTDQYQSTIDLHMLTGGYWIWQVSYILPNSDNGKFFFYNAPYKVWGKSGQYINGCCCAGYSIYGEICPCSQTPNASLLFYTYEQYKKETFVFSTNSFTRKTLQDYSVPLPDSSNFCVDQTGYIEKNTLSVLYKGGLSTTEVMVPNSLRDYYDTRDNLILAQTSSDPEYAGYGNPGGVVHKLTPDELVLIQLDREGFGQDLYKVYYHSLTGVNEAWFSLHH